MLRFRLRGLCLLLGFVGCARATKPPTASQSTAQPPGQKQINAAPQQELAALFTRELDGLPPLESLAGSGWAMDIPGKEPRLSSSTVEGSENLSFSFEGSASCDCTVFSESFDAATYVGNLVEELKKSLEIVNIAPTRFAVEQEIPIYFLSLFYRKRSAEGNLAGQLKLALSMHPKRPVVCLHDVPGYTATFETVVRTSISHYHVTDDTLPVAASVSVARIGTLPVGFSRETIQLLGGGRTEYTSTSAQIVPRSKDEVMVSDEAEVVVADNASLVEGHYVQGDVRGEKLNITLLRAGASRYKVSGSLGQNTFATNFSTRAGLPGPDAIAQRLRAERRHRRPFHFTQLEYHPALDPSNPVEVSYSRTESDPEDCVHVKLGQLEMLMTLDPNSEPLKSELGAGSQTVVFERMSHRDNRKQNDDSPKRSASH